MAVTPDSSVVAAGLICLVVLGAAVGGQPPRNPAAGGVGDGTAELRISSPATDELRMTPGRFGTAAWYLRTPDLVVDVTAVEGRPRVVYRLVVPALEVDRQVHEVVTGTGRFRLRMADRAYPPDAVADFPAPEQGSGYEGYLVARVQSFAADRTVHNQSVRVRVDR